MAFFLELAKILRPKEAACDPVEIDNVGVDGFNLDGDIVRSDGRGEDARLFVFVAFERPVFEGLAESFTNFLGASDACRASNRRI